MGGNFKGWGGAGTWESKRGDRGYEEGVEKGYGSKGQEGIFKDRRKEGRNI